jgi:hypothetical protein
MEQSEFFIDCKEQKRIIIGEKVRDSECREIEMQKVSIEKG